LKGDLKYEPKESCDNFSLPGLENLMQIPAATRGNFYSPKEIGSPQEIGNANPVFPDAINKKLT
jgi:hypothetical protein